MTLIASCWSSTFASWASIMLEDMKLVRAALSAATCCCGVGGAGATLHSRILLLMRRPMTRPAEFDA